VEFSPDGRVLVAADRDPPYPAEKAGARRICLWSVHSGQKLGEFRGYDSDVRALAFSPDGTRLASGQRDTTILLWDTTSHVARKTGEADLPARELEKLWADLGERAPVKGYAVIARLLTAPEKSTAFLKEQLTPAQALDAGQVRRWLADLGDARFAVRDKAFQQLKNLSRQAEPLLQEALDQDPPLEVKKRLSSLVELCRTINSPEVLRRLRAIQALEHIGSAQARQVLQNLSRGAPEAPETQDAKAAVERLGR
jgi:hypothetical protein